MRRDGTNGGRPEIDAVMLDDQRPIFVGFKLDGTLKRELQSVAGADRRYVSSDDSTFLRICRLGDDDYVGKVIHDRLSTDRVEDVRRNVLSILRRLCPEARLPEKMEILACRLDEDQEKKEEPSDGGGLFR